MTVLAEREKYMRLLAASIILLAPLPAAAASTADFSCANRAAEIRCADGRCEILTPDDGFTPMRLVRAGKTLSICAYSGCWEGPILARHALGPMMTLQASVKRQGGDEAEPATPLSVIHDADSGTAQMNWGGFANVMECGARDE